MATAPRSLRVGYERHNAIIVTGPMKAYGIPEKAMEEVRNEVFRIAELEGLGQLVSGVIPGSSNCMGTFILVPDGSKEGWDASDKGDLTRDRVISYLDTLRYSDGSTSFSFVEVQFGDDDLETKVVRDSDEVRRAEVD